MNSCNLRCVCTLKSDAHGRVSLKQLLSSKQDKNKTTRTDTTRHDTRQHEPTPHEQKPTNRNEPKWSPQDSILDVVTSGEIAWEGLRQREEEPFKSLGTKCLVFGNGDDDLEVTINSKNYSGHTVYLACQLSIHSVWATAPHTEK